MLVILALVLSARTLEAQVPFQYGADFSALLRAACHGLQRAVGLFDPSRIFAPLADGGGDGGGGDGSSSSDGGGSGDSSGGGDGGNSGDSGGSGGGDGSSGADAGGAGDGSSTGADGVGADGATSADPGTPDAPADVGIDATANTVPDVPTDNPAMSLRGGEAPSGMGSGAFAPPLAPFPPGLPPGSGGVAQDIAIHAVIVSGVQSPWNAISRAPGVRNLTLTGGLVALGRTLRSGETVAGESPPSFLKIIPDPKLLNGSMIPPVVPNVIDVRIVGYSVSADMPGN